ncbi:MAG: pitrilysin family protein [Lautropia sp.]|nr:pitrilysin family protein [Lautropia sp.]
MRLRTPSATASRRLTIPALLVALVLGGLGTPGSAPIARESAPASTTAPSATQASGSKEATLPASQTSGKDATAPAAQTAPAATIGSDRQAAVVSATTPTAIDGIVQVGQAINGISEYRLKNGLTVLLGPDESKPTMTVNLTYKVGSRHEGPGEAGMAHLLEHMLFKGTEKIPDPKKELTKRGIDWNGTTWYDRTNYFGQFNASDATRDWMLEWLSDTMTNVRISADKLKGERPIVINEMQASENRPATVLYQQLMNTAYGFHPYGRSVIGVQSDLDEVSPGSLQAFYKSYYRPDNAVLIITGKFDVEPTLAAVQKAFGGIARPDAAVPQPYTLDAAQNGEREVVLRRTGGVPLMLVGYHTPAGAERDTVALAILAEMLTREPDGPLHQQLVKTGLAASVGGSTTDLFDPGMLVMNATLADVGKQKAVWDTMRRVLEDELPLTQESLNRTKQDVRNYMKRLLDDPESLAMSLTESIAQGDWRLMFAQSDWVETMTLDEIRAAGKRWLVRDNRTLAWYLPTPKPVRAPAPSRPDIAALLKDHPWKQAEAFKADFEMNPASITERTQIGKLDSGLEYALLPRQVKGDRVSVNLQLQWGNLDNLKGRWREADGISTMLLSGTRTLSRQQLQDKLRALDAALDVNADADGLTLALHVPAKNLDEALALGISTIREPVFPADIFRERMDASLTRIQAQRHQPDALVSEALGARTHAYPADDPRHVRNIDQVIADAKKQTPERLAKFWQDFAGASHGQFSAVGNFNPETLKASLQKLLGDWKSPQAYARIEKPFHGLPGEQVYLSVPDKANAVFYQGRSIPVSEDHPDYPALSMAIRLLGGNPGTRISNRLREQESISYGAYATLSAQRDINDATIAIRAILAPANLMRLEKALAEEIDKTLKEGFTQQELDSARGALQDLRKQYLSGEGNVSGLLVSNLYWDSTMKRWTDYDEKLAKLTLDDVNAAFRKWFDPKKSLTIGAGSFKETPVPAIPVNEDDKDGQDGKPAQP